MKSSTPKPPANGWYYQLFHALRHVFRRALCSLDLHGWEYQGNPGEYGTIRKCRDCGHQEVLKYTEPGTGWNSEGEWINYKPAQEKKPAL